MVWREQCLVDGWVGQDGRQLVHVAVQRDGVDEVVLAACAPCSHAGQGQEQPAGGRERAPIRAASWQRLHPTGRRTGGDLHQARDAQVGAQRVVFAVQRDADGALQRAHQRPQLPRRADPHAARVTHGGWRPAAAGRCCSLLPVLWRVSLQCGDGSLVRVLILQHDQE